MAKISKCFIYIARCINDSGCYRFKSEFNFFYFEEKLLTGVFIPWFILMLQAKENNKMKAKEIEEIFGISSQKIKDYKKAGVFSSTTATPNGKTIDYSLEDVENLVKINVLGKAGLTVKDIGEVQNGKCTLQQAFLNRYHVIEEKIKQYRNSLELLQTFVTQGFTYEDFPTMQQWEIINKNMANGAQYYDEFEDDGLDFERTIECPCCHNKITVDLSDYEYDTSSYENENGMGPDCVYSFDSGEEIICDKCGAILNVSGWIREYPLGAYDSEDIDVDVIEVE